MAMRKEESFTPDWLLGFQGSNLVNGESGGSKKGF